MPKTKKIDEEDLRLIALLRIAEKECDAEDWSTAERASSEAVKIARRKYGRKDVKMAGALSSLAIALSNLKKTREALTLAQEAYSILAEKLGEHDRLTQGAIINIAYVYQIRTEYEKAESILQMVIDNEEKSGRSQGINQVHALINLANVYREWKKLFDAEMAIRTALDMAIDSLGDKDQGLVRLYDILHQVLLDQGRNKEADEVMRKANKIRSKSN